MGPRSRRARRFGAFGDGSAIVFPWDALFGERWMRIGAGTIVGPHSALSVGMAPGQQMVTDPVLVIGDRCVIGRGSSIVAHLEVVIGDDVWTGPHIYVTDQNHDYRDVDLPIGVQHAGEEPVHIGSGSWLGTGAVILPGSRIGDHVVVGAGSVVTGDLPDRSVVVGVPARVVRRWDPVAGWIQPAGSAG
ncbi:MAG: acyltransferase [Acidimicrobiales bacterium]|nr:acyltransferase [Acidimicrobiales bacterium]